MNGGALVARGPASRAVVTPALLRALSDRYGLRNAGAVDLGGSSNLNLLVGDGPRRFVARVYRPWVTPSRLSAIQQVRTHLAGHDVPCALPALTRDGQPWIEVDGRLVEVEPYVGYDARMNSWELLERGLPLLGRIHTLLEAVEVNADGRAAPAANHIESEQVVDEVREGTRHIRGWDASPNELLLADAADELAGLVDHAERHSREGRRQLVHGDFWDNNVLFREGAIVQVGDFDFMGERPRIDDLALTLYYTNSTFAEGATSADRPRQIRVLVDAYDSGLNERLTLRERESIPLALARTPLCFVAMIPSVDSEAGARRLASEVAPDIAWALAMVRDLDRWRSALA